MEVKLGRTTLKVSPRYIDILVAENVMGYTSTGAWTLEDIPDPDDYVGIPPGLDEKGERFQVRTIPYFTTNEYEDYKVLKRVREHWLPADQVRFFVFLTEMLRSRVLVGSPDDESGYDLMYYEGDYSLAALRVVDEDTGSNFFTKKPGA